MRGVNHDSNRHNSIHQPCGRVALGVCYSCITANFEVALMPGGWRKVISEEEELKLAEGKAANEIGKYIIDNGLCEVLRSHDDNFNCDRLRYVLRVIEPPKIGMYIHCNVFLCNLHT